MHIVPQAFHVYMLDPEHGWHKSDLVKLNEAITLAEDWRSHWAGSRVALVPDGMAADPFLEFASAIA